MDGPFPVLPEGDLPAKFERWLALVGQMHGDFAFCGNPAPAWTPLRKPPGQCRVALLSTAGVHLKAQPAFDLMDHHGDWSHREIPGTVAAADLMASHAHYDTTDANADINCVFPIDALRQLQAEGFVGSVSPLHIGMMGFVPNGARLRDGGAAPVAEKLRAHGVDAVVVTPG